MTSAVSAPYNPFPDEKLATIQDNSVSAIQIPFLPKIGSLGILGDYNTIIELSLAAEKYNLNEKEFVKIAFCESSFNENAVGKAGEFGIFQFKEKTFYQYCEGDWKNTENQITCAAKMMAEGKKSHWTCAK